MRNADYKASGERIPVVIYHRDALLRLGIAATLRGVAQFEVQTLDPDGEPSDWCPDVRPGTVLVCDYEAALALAPFRWSPQEGLHLMVVTQRDREADVHAALSLGVQGYLLVGCRQEEVIEGALALSRGQRFLSSLAAQRVADRISYEALTPREDEVLRHVALGWSNKMIANRLGVTEGTVKSHVKAVLAKLAVRTRTEAASLALRRGLVHAEVAASEVQMLQEPRASSAQVGRSAAG